jgi:serine/threonine protein kinase
MQPGHIINDHYQLGKLIDRDEVGYLYQAIDTQNNNQPCLLKIFAPRNLSPQDFSRACDLFIRESQILRSLEHPNLPKFIDAFEFQLNGSKSACFVQSEVQGTSHRDILLQKTFKAEDVTWILYEGLKVLDYLHTQRPPIIHRNLTLDTLIQTPQRVPTLINFGLSRCINEFEDETVSNVATPGFSPPEQIQGKISPSTDLYALAIIAICLLTGEVKPQNLQPNGQWNWKTYAPRDLDPALIRILDQLLSPNPNDRQPSARLALAALKPLIEDTGTRRVGQPSSRTATTIPSAAPIPINRTTLRPWIIGAVGFVSIIFLWNTIGKVLSNFASSPASSKTPTATATTTPASNPMPSESPTPTPSESPGICRDRVLTRGDSLGITTWDTVDQQFSQQYPELNGASIDAMNPNHRAYIKSWCDIANQWMDKLEKP